MNQQQPQVESKQVEEPLQIRDCGRATEKTRGFLIYVFYENGFPPFNTTFFWN
jgi:hypothetical protein